MTRQAYPSDLSDAQWRLLEPLVPRPKPGGRPARYARRDIVNAILYQVRNGCAWRSLPHDLPPYRIVFHYFRLWQKDGNWDRIHDALRNRVRKEADKTPKPTALILDSQSVKMADQGGPKGYDAGKKSRRA
jgi:transposase